MIEEQDRAGWSNKYFFHRSEHEDKRLRRDKLLCVNTFYLFIAV